MSVTNGEPRDQLRYSIVDDDSGGAYALDSETGAVFLADASRLDPGTQPIRFHRGYEPSCGLTS